MNDAKYYYDIVQLCVANGYIVRICHDERTIYGETFTLPTKSIALVPGGGGHSYTAQETKLFPTWEQFEKYVKENFYETAQIPAQSVAPRPSKMQGQEPHAGSDEQPAEGGMEGGDRLPQSTALGRLSDNTAAGVLLHFTRGV